MPSTAETSTPSLNLADTDAVVRATVLAKLELRWGGIMDECDGERIEVRVVGPESKGGNPCPGTACWAFRNPPNVHLITVDSAAMEVAPRGMEAEMLRSLIIHEAGHAVFTDRDLAAVSKECKKRGFPFMLLNLGEDVRIESRMRERGCSMPWHKVDSRVPESADPAGYLLWLLYQSEVPEAERPAPFAASETPAWEARVREHYFRAFADAANTSAVIDIAEQFAKEFSVPNQSQSGQGEGSGSNGGDANGDGQGGSSSDSPKVGSAGTDLENGAALLADGKAFLEGVEEAEKQAEEAKRDKEDARCAGGQGEANSVTAEKDFTNAPIVVDTRPMMALDEGEVQKVASRIRRMLRAGESWESTAVPSRRLNRRAIGIPGRLDLFRRRSDPRPSHPARIVYFQDCSGSMTGGPQQSGALLLAALSALAERHLIEGHAVFSRVSRRREQVQTVKLPVPVRFLNAIPADGDAEGLACAFETAMPLLRKADFCLCFTDGAICDRPLPTESLERKGIRPLALYVGNEAMASRARDFFRDVLVRPTLPDLLDGMLTVIGPALRMNHRG